MNRWTLMLIPFFCSTIASAQPGLRGPTLSGGFQISKPQGEFAEFYQGTPYGFNANLSVPILSLPLEGGFGFSWNRMGGNSTQIDFTDPLGRIQSGELKVTGNAYTYYLHGRLRPFNGKFRPYADLMAGMRNYSVRSAVQPNSNLEFNADPMVEVSDRDFTWVSGWAVGIQYRIVSALMLEARFEKWNGDRAQYLNPNSLSFDASGSFDYEMHQSSTDQLSFSLGLALGF